MAQLALSLASLAGSKSTAVSGQCRSVNGKNFGIAPYIQFLSATAAHFSGPAHSAAGAGRVAAGTVVGWSKVELLIKMGLMLNKREIDHKSYN